VLPELRTSHAFEVGLRVWSAGCASGEEPYSLAILLDEEGWGERAYLLATDISRAALAKARRATYGTWSLRGEGARFARPYLKPRGSLFTLDEKIRRRVYFECLNLALDVYPSFATNTWGMNLILCRNVLIYFDRDTVRAVVRRLYESLAPGGWLITASVDPPLTEHAPFEPVLTDAGVFFRRPGLDQVPASPLPGKPEARNPKSETIRAVSDFEVRISDFPAQREVGPPPSPLTTPPDGTPVSLSPPLDARAEARAAFGRGDYERAAEWTAGLTADVEASTLHVRALANVDAVRADQACAGAVGRHPLSAELHYLHAVLLVALHRDDEAARALRRVLYLDRTLAIAHFTLGAVQERRGDQGAARRAYRKAQELASARPPEELVPLSDGEPAGRLAEAAATQLAVLEHTQEVLS
jgi:chemotaxis protein methyltransferase CheR